jgi:Uma2 family endonuclease
MSTVEIEEPGACTFILRPELAGTLMTPAEFDAATESDENYDYELIHGVFVVTPPPREEERGPNEELGFLLRFYRLHDPRGSALDATLAEQHIRTAENRRRADRVIWSGLGRDPNPKRDIPTIVVEFVSAGKQNRNRDYAEKRAEYLAAGVREYWIIDRFKRTLTVCHSNGRDEIVPEDGIYRNPLLPGFELTLARLLDIADRWKASKND